MEITLTYLLGAVAIMIIGSVLTNLILAGLKNKKDNNGKTEYKCMYLTEDGHELRCKDRLEPIKASINYIKEKVDDIHATMVEMKSNQRKRGND